jgi:alkylation response protein AidB-like acyl-CoA dehydrogenase
MSSEVTLSYSYGASATPLLGETIYRDVRVLRIGGGADEIQLEILSRELTP